MKNLTRIQAWKKIRQAFLKYEREGKREGKEMDLSRFGLCHAVRILQDSMHTNTFYAMRRDIIWVRPADAPAHFWPLTRAGARERVKAIDKMLAKIKK